MTMDHGLDMGSHEDDKCEKKIDELGLARLDC